MASTSTKAATKATTNAAAPAPVAATQAPATTATTPAAPQAQGLNGCVLLPLQPATASHGAAIYAAAQGYPVGPLAAAKLGAAASYLTGAASWLACAALGYHSTKPGKGKGVGYAAAWYCPTSGQVYATTGQPLPQGGHGAHHGATPATAALVWAKLAQAVCAYHTAQATTPPAWAQPAPVAAPQAS